MDHHASQKTETSAATPIQSASHGRGWKADLARLLSTKGRVAARKAKPVSNRTQDKREEVLYQSFYQLGKLGYRLARASDFGDRHVKALMTHWEDQGLSASTLQNRLSILRTLSVWLGKKGMVRGIEAYLKDPSKGRRVTVAQYDHSWSAAGIDAAKTIRLVSSYDKHVGMQLALMHAFALRREEAVMFRPNRADQGSYIIVRDGTKGGRERTVAVDTEYQRTVLDDARKMARTINGHVGRPNLDLKQALRRFNYVCGEKFGLTAKALGVTSHGLRHQGLNDLFETLSGIPSPVRGATADMFLEVDPLRVEFARARVAEVAGHSRLSISSAYLGGQRKTTPAVRQTFAWERINELRKKGAPRTAEETSELEALIDQLMAQIVDR